MKAHRKNAHDRQEVFDLIKQQDWQFRRDLRLANIETVDSLGRKVDFHALRYTFATKLARQGVSQRFAQELMRHSDPKLTANLYTDASKLPTFDAVEELSWLHEKKEKDTQIDPQKPDQTSHERAYSDTETSLGTNAKVIDCEKLEHEKACAVTNCHRVLREGFEPSRP